mgnify:CR=1 FL=1
MKIESIQKIIKVGSSNAVTLPARDLKANGLETGDVVKITIKPLRKKVVKQAELLREYEQFKSVYGKTLKNLTDR